MTSMTATTERVAIIGTGLLGTSVALAAARAGASVTGWDVDSAVASRAAELGAFPLAPSFEHAVAPASLVVIATPIGSIPAVVAEALAVAPEAIVTDVGSVKTELVRQVASLSEPRDLPRFVPGHPMGGASARAPTTRRRRWSTASSGRSPLTPRATRRR